MTFANASVNVPMAPPGQMEKGAVTRMARPSATTPISSGVIRVNGSPRDMRPISMEVRPNSAASSANGTAASPGIWSCGRK